MILNVKLVFEDEITWKGYISLTFEVVVYLAPENVVHRPHVEDEDRFAVVLDKVVNPLRAGQLDIQSLVVGKGVMGVFC
jgi:hypothetical protein